MYTKSSTIEFYHIEFIEKKDSKGRKDKHLFMHDFNEYSNIQPFTNDFKTIFEYIQDKIENSPILLEQNLSRGKKHRMVIDEVHDEGVEAYFVRETQSGVLIDKKNFNIRLAHDSKLKVELANLSHYIIDTKYKVLALETFQGSTTKTAFLEYLNKVLEDTNCRINLNIISRDDIVEVLNNVKAILKFKGKYRNVQPIMSGFIQNHIFSPSKSEKLKRAIENKNYEGSLEIKFSEFEEMTSEDVVIERFKNGALNNPESNDDNIIEEKITLLTIQGDEEIIQLGSNIFIEKLEIKIDETLETREQYSSHIYEMILERIAKIIEIKKW